MQVYSNPSPVPAGSSYTVSASGGVPPYGYSLLACPPNPPGLTLVLQGGAAVVEVPESVPLGTPLFVAVVDGAQPTPGAQVAVNTVGPPR